jgi:energy-coupling factor transporter transmembrane protein EcfT
MRNKSFLFWAFIFVILALFIARGGLFRLAPLIKEMLPFIVIGLVVGYFTPKKLSTTKDNTKTLTPCPNCGTMTIEKNHCRQK